MIDLDESGPVISTPPSKPAKPRIAWSYVLLGCLALASAGYNAFLIVRRGIPRGLEVVGPAKVSADRTDRTTPFDHVFPLRNPTSHPIKIRHVSTSCTCTTGDLADSQIIEPGQTVPFRMRVNSFDSYAAGFAEMATVETDDGRLDVWMTGTLPVGREVLYRPKTLSLAPDADGHWSERTVMIRVPKACAIEPRATVAGLPGADILVTEGPSTDGYREFTIRLRPSRLRVKGRKVAILRIETGCEPLEILIQVETSAR